MSRRRPDGELSVHCSSAYSRRAYTRICRALRLRTRIFGEAQQQQFFSGGDDARDVYARYKARFLCFFFEYTAGKGCGGLNAEVLE